jgi:hypothetical protein
VRGWDYFTGYGRENAYRLVAFIGIEDHPVAGSREYVGPHSTDVASSALSAQDRIPPEADITAPRWWGQFPYRTDYSLLDPQDPGQDDVIVVEGRAAANRVTAAGGRFGYVLEWAPHVQGQKYPLGSLQGAAGSEEKSGGPWFPAGDRDGPQPARRRRAGAHPGRRHRLGAHVEREPVRSRDRPDQRVPARALCDPAAAARDRPAAQSRRHDQQRSGDAEADRRVPRIGDGDPRRSRRGGPDRRRLRLSELPRPGRRRYRRAARLQRRRSDPRLHRRVERGGAAGWPVTTAPFHGVLAGGANAYTNGGMPSEAYDSILAGAPGVADLDDDGHLEIVVGDLEGRVHVFEADGSTRAGFPVQVDLALSQQPPCSAATIPACDEHAASPKQDLHNKRDRGISSAPAIGDLDPAYPGLELVAGSHDNHVYAWHQDGTPVPGWPVVLRDPAKVATMDATTHNFTLAPGAGAVRDGTKVIVSPSLGDLDGDGDLEVVVGVNEQYAEDPNAALAPELLALGYLVVPGNARIYALHPDGANHAATPAQNATPHTQDQAYVSGWPVPIAVIQTDLLPDVGTGTNGQSPLADIDGNGDLEIVTASAAGPGYILNHDGTSFLGIGDGGKYRTLATSGGAASDVPSYIAVGALGIASLDGGLHLSVLGPGGGLKRVLDVVIPAQQLGGQDHFSFWNATTGLYEPGSPVVVNDLQFFTGPDRGRHHRRRARRGDPGQRGVGHGRRGARHPVRRGHALPQRRLDVSSAGIGDAPLGEREDGMLSLATTTREGYLRVYPTAVAAGSVAACTALAEWPQFGHDAHNSGNYETDAERPYPLRDVSAPGAVTGTSVNVTLTATGDDRACGSASTYQIRSLPGDVADPDWLLAAPLQTAPVGAASGASDTIAVSGLAAGVQTLLVRAYDDAGNGSATSRIVVLPEPSRVAGLAAASLLLFALVRRARPSR